jgi:hypothetical protein
MKVIVICKNVFRENFIQRVTEISTLILTGNRTRQKEQLFYLPFCRKTMFNSKKRLERFFTKITLRHKILQWLIEISANMKKTSIFIQKTCFNAEIEIQINLPV